MRLIKALKLLEMGKCGCHIPNKSIVKFYTKLYKLTNDPEVKRELDDFITPIKGQIGLQEITSYSTGCCLKNLKERLEQLNKIRSKK